MRGKVFRGEVRHSIVGITPAYAGKSAAVHRACRNRWDHPRVCGEKGHRYTLPPLGVGSPPRMRGKGVKPRNKRVAMGITPAYAGKRWPSESPCPPCRDHPRVCGEKSPICLDSLPLVGSPPRMRGKALRRHQGSHRTGITPAYAGKRQMWSMLLASARDHPRVCGEKTSSRQRTVAPSGSPPRVRGKAPFVMPSS